MRILFDHGVAAPLKPFIEEWHSVKTAKSQGWDRISNGDLLAVAELAGFDVILTTDKKIRYQQNLTGRKIAILGNGQWPELRPHVRLVVDAVDGALPGSYREIEIPR